MVWSPNATERNPHLTCCGNSVRIVNSELGCRAPRDKSWYENPPTKAIKRAMTRSTVCMMIRLIRMRVTFETCDATSEPARWQAALDLARQRLSANRDRWAARLCRYLLARYPGSGRSH